MSSVSVAQDLSLKGRSAIELSLGFWGGAKASNTVGLTGIRSEAGTNGLAGGLGYSYWLQEHLSLTVSASLLSGQASTTVSISNVTQQASAVIPLLLGVRFYVPDPETGENVRPFLSAAVGTYFGSEATNALFSQQAHVETAIGGRLGVGIDFFLGNHFKLGANLGYHLMTDFETAVGGRKNYNGADFSMGTGYIF
jgi:hypothetical protein